jgi:hypothetical protein
MFRAFIFFSLVTSAFASQTSDALIDAAAGFLAAIQQQLQAVESNPSHISIGGYIVTAVGTTAFVLATNAWHFLLARTVVRRRFFQTPGGDREDAA